LPIGAKRRGLIVEGKKANADRKTFIYISNRLEANALETIDATLEGVEYPRCLGLVYGRYP